MYTIFRFVISLDGVRSEHFTRVSLLLTASSELLINVDFAH